MTDISKYKNVSLSKDTYIKIDKLRRIIQPNTVMSRSQTISILVNEKEREKMNKTFIAIFTFLGLMTLLSLYMLVV